MVGCSTAPPLQYDREVYCWLIQITMTDTYYIEGTDGCNTMTNHYNSSILLITMTHLLCIALKVRMATVLGLLLTAKETSPLTLTLAT